MFDEIVNGSHERSNHAPQRVELLTVEDTLWLGRNGVTMLILHPDFSLPPGWEQRGWSERTEPSLSSRTASRLRRPPKST
jgi:hypothetical protein